MSETIEDQRRAAVYREAFAAFTNYGYKRTTMDDIATAAGMSRPALYLLYKNKADILRACMLSMMDSMRDSVAACLAGDLPIVEKIEAALDIAIVVPYRSIVNTPHGAEIFDLKNEHAADLFYEWIAVIEREIAAGLRRDAEKGRIDPARAGVSVERIAMLLLDCVEGSKARVSSGDALCQRIGDHVRLMIGPLVI